jgi:hypothetical protein
MADRQDMVVAMAAEKAMGLQNADDLKKDRWAIALCQMIAMTKARE